MGAVVGAVVGETVIHAAVYVATNATVSVLKGVGRVVSWPFRQLGSNDDDED